jgi:transcriptional regulator
MYLPDHFKEVDPDQIASVIAGAPLACVVANTSDGLIANHVPLLFDKSGDLIGHFALANDMHRIVDDGQEILAIFRGVDGYISPNSYPSKQEHHRHVPTWNYQIVHVYGAISFQHDARSKRAAIGLLTRSAGLEAKRERGTGRADVGKTVNHRGSRLSALLKSFGCR